MDLPINFRFYDFIIHDSRIVRIVRLVPIFIFVSRHFTRFNWKIYFLFSNTIREEGFQNINNTLTPRARLRARECAYKNTMRMYGVPKKIPKKWNCNDKSARIFGTFFLRYLGGSLRKKWKHRKAIYLWSIKFWIRLFIMTLITIW